MSLFSLFIKRPVSAIMFNMAMVIAGIACFLGLPYNNMPDVDLPIVTIFVQLPGGNPETIESEVTKRIEDAVSSISGIDELSSTTTSGSASIVAQFIMEKNVDVAVQEVHDKINLVQSNFPSGTLTPIVQKVSPSDTPILILTVSSERDLKEMTEICRQDVKNFLQSINGVGQVTILGGRFREISIALSADQLNKYGLAVDAVSRAIDSQNTEVPGGKVTGSLMEYSMRSTGRLNHVKQFEDIVVGEINGTQVYLKDIAEISDATKEQRTVARQNGVNSIAINIIKVKGGNTVNVIKNVKAKMEELKSILPSDMELEIIKDQSVLIEESVHEIFVHLFLGGGLACLLTFLFMRSIKTTFIAAVAIPTSVIATFIVMKVMNYTLDNITLLALALVVGLVIDDAIVVLENIWRIIEEEGLDPYSASIKGIQDVGFAVFATSVSLMVIFLPLGFIGGLVGKFISCYGITMATSVFFSMLVSFTLTPMLCSKLMTPPKKKGETDLLTKWLQAGYAFILKIFLNPIGTIVVFVVCGALLVWSLTLAKNIGAEFTAAQDDSQYDIAIKLPVGWPIARSSELLLEIEKELLALPDMKYVITTIGTANPGDDFNESSDITKANIYLQLKEFKERSYGIDDWLKDVVSFKKPQKLHAYTQFESMRSAREIVKKYSSMLRSQVNLESSMNGQASPQFSFILLGQDLAKLESAMSYITNKLKATSGIEDVDTNLILANPELHIDFDRKAASDQGVDIQRAAQTVAIMVGGMKLGSNYLEDHWSYDIRLRLKEEDRHTPQAVNKLYITNSSGQAVLLSSIADITGSLGPSSISHYGGQRAVTLTCNFDGYSAAKAMQDCQKYVKELKLPPGYGEAYTGNSKYMQETAVSLLGALIIAFLFVYMVLAAQFESYFDPLIIMATIPMTVPFALISLSEMGKTLNLFSALGLFLLFGIVMKNAILQIEHGNHIINTSGMPYKESIILANKDRIRPILMTTLTIIVGMLPVALAGANGNLKSPMAIVVVGGQSLCFFLTLVLVPVLHNMLHSFYAMIGKSKKAKVAVISEKPEVTEKNEDKIEVMEKPSQKNLPKKNKTVPSAEDIKSDSEKALKSSEKESSNPKDSPSDDDKPLPQVKSNKDEKSDTNKENN